MFFRYSARMRDREPARGVSLGAGVAAISLLTAACGAEHASEEGTPTGATCPTAQTLSYANFGQAFMQSYCLKCHSSSVSDADRRGAPSDHNFDELDAIRNFAEHIDEYAGAGPAATNTIMPPEEPRPSEDDRRKLSEWLACGAPE